MRLRRLAGSVIAISLLAASVVAVGAARADTVTVPPGSPDPWSSAAHNTPLEVLASTIASSLAGRSVSVRCEAQVNWDALTAGSGGADVIGFVQDPPDSSTTQITKYRYVWRIKKVHGKKKRVHVKVPYIVVQHHADMFTESANVIELSPTVCGPLQQFAEQSTKATKCAPNGAPVPCFIGTPTNQYPGICTDQSLTTCFTIAQDWSDDYWKAYDGYAQAVLTLAHETVHIVQGTVGKTVPSDSLVESQAECTGLQTMAQVAVQLGDTADDAQQLADYTWLMVYPSKAKLTDAYATQHPYWSADCAPGGPLDIRPPGSTVWP